MPLMSDEEYAASLNRKRAVAGVLFRHEDGRVLLVEPSYKPTWEIPGGSVEPDEAPWLCARREVLEELGVEAHLGPLLVVDHVPAHEFWPEMLAFVWDGGLVTEEDVDAMRPDGEEILSVSLAPVVDLPTLVTPGLAARISAAFLSLDTGFPILCDSGRPDGGRPEMRADVGFPGESG